MLDGTLEVFTWIKGGPRKWISPYGKSEFYRTRVIDGMECEFGPFHQGYTDVPSGWWWRIRRGWATVSSGNLRDRGCFAMRRTAKHVEEEAQRVLRSFAMEVPSWEVGYTQEWRTREMGGLTLRFHATSFPESGDDSGWHWGWALLKADNFVEQGTYHSSGHLDFTEVARFVEERARKHLFKLSEYR